METMDNGTLVESFKFLNYFQLAKNSLASKRFRDVIRRHRHILTRLYVESIRMESCNFLERPIQIFDKDLSPEEYNEWIVRNEYSKQIPLECQVAEIESTEDERKFYKLKARYKVSPNLEQSNTVFLARAELNHENWPLFQHFIRLLTDPFIYIHSMDLTARNEILYLIEKTDCDRIQCGILWLYLKDNAPKFISWIKDHVCCDQFPVLSDRYSNELNCDRELLDLFMSGANCSSRVIFHSNFSWRNSFPKLVDDFVQKFLDLKEYDEYQVVKTIGFEISNGSIDGLKEKYIELIVKEESSNRGTPMYTFEFVNNDIGKKLQLNTQIVPGPGYSLTFQIL